MPVTVGLLVFAIGCIVICYVVAKKRGARVSFWVVMAALFGPLAIPFVFFAKPVAVEGSGGSDDQSG